PLQCRNLDRFVALGEGYPTVPDARSQLARSQSYRQYPIWSFEDGRLRARQACARAPSHGPHHAKMVV
ncbi:hypothetical protein MGN70_001411, partial [Eutypa lata]